MHSSPCRRSLVSKIWGPNGMSPLPERSHLQLIRMFQSQTLVDENCLNTACHGDTRQGCSMWCVTEACHKHMPSDCQHAMSFECGAQATYGNSRHLTASRKLDCAYFWSFWSWCLLSHHARIVIRGGQKWRREGALKHNSIGKCMCRRSTWR